MTNVKITQLPGSSVPLNGDEVFPIVQSGVTVQTPISSVLTSPDTISTLPAATTPLTGSETFPLVQSGVSKQVSVASFIASPGAAAANLDALRNTSPAAYPVITLQGYTNPNDGGGGTFYSVTGQPTSTYSDNGGTIILPYGGDGSSAWIRLCSDQIDLRWFGALADDSTDCWAALNAAVAAGYNYFIFNSYEGEANVAKFDSWNSATIIGCTFDVDPAITFSTLYNYVVGDVDSLQLRHVRPTQYYFRALDDYYTVNSEGGQLTYGDGKVRAMPYMQPYDANLAFPVAIQAATLTPRKILWNTSDTWTADTFSSSSGQDYTVAFDASYNLHIGFTPCKPGDEFVVSMTGSTTISSLLLAACVHHTDGFSGVWAQNDYVTQPSYFSKTTGVNGTSSTISVFGGTTHSTLTGAGAVWTIRIISWNTFAILFNGCVMVQTSTSGIIYECGFGAYLGAAGQTATVSDLIRMRGNQYRGGQFAAVGIYGDSKSAPRYDDWATYFKDALEFTAGVRCWYVADQAVSGQASAAQLAVMQADALSGLLGALNVVIIDIGTNDVQAGVSVATFRSNVQAMITLAQSFNLSVVLGVPSLWYTQTQSGGKGQLSVNYEKGAPYRSAIFALAAQNSCKVVDNTRWDGPVLANYVNAALTPDLTAAGDPVVYDNIHPTTECNKRRALAYAQVVEGLYVYSNSNLYLPIRNISGTFSNNWTSTTQTPTVTISADGIVNLYGTIDADVGAVRTDGTVVYTLPQYLWPQVVIRAKCVSQNSTENVWVNVTTAGAISIYGCAASTWFDLSSLTYCVENREVL